MKYYLAYMLILLVGLTSNSFADQPRTESKAISNERSPIIDGDLNDDVWKDIPIISDFHQIRPKNRGKPSERTEAQIAHNKNFLFVAFKVFDSNMDELDAKILTQGQRLSPDDRVSITFDTFNDRRNSYVFEVNANAVRLDGLVGNDYVILDWDTVWYAETKLYDWGWSAEFAIPAKSLAFDPNSSTWGLNLARILPRRGEAMAWSSSDRNFTRPAVAGYLDKVSGLQQGLGIELIPSATLSHFERNGSEDDTSFEPSLTTFYNITPFLTAGLTLNTDFSGVEVDDRRVNLTRFSLFFPEKRDFFLRDSNIFAFGGLDRNARPFFSRRIGLSNNGNPLDIDAGIKLTGRAGDWNLGALAIQQEPGVDNGDETLFVGRASRNVFDESEIGIITTHGDPNSNRDNSLFGMDYTYRNSKVFGDKNFQANTWYQKADTEGLEDNQNAYGLGLSYPNDKFSGNIEYRRVEENFNPALGFANRTGVDQIESQLGYKHRLKNSFWQWLGASAQLSRSDRISGGIQSEEIFYEFFQGLSKRGDFFTLFINETTEGIIRPFRLTPDLEIPAGIYKSDRYGAFFDTGQQRNFSASLSLRDGDFFDGTNFVVSPSLRWRPNKHLFISMSAGRNEIKLPQGNFTSRLYSARVNYSFNSRWAWFNILQADNLSNTLSFNSRIRYQPRADREYLLVFDQTRDRVSDDILSSSIIFKASFNFRL